MECFFYHLPFKIYKGPRYRVQQIAVIRIIFAPLLKANYKVIGNHGELNTNKHSAKNISEND